MSTEVGKVFARRAPIIDSARRLCDAVFDEFIEADQLFVAERTPLHVFHLPLIAEIYPDAKFIHIIRDGRDVARSIVAQDWGPATLAEAAAEWRDAVQAGRRAALGPDRYLEVRYEEMLAHPNEQFAELYGWLGLPTGADDLAFPLQETKRAENVDRFGIQGIATDKWKRAFTAADIATFESVAGDLLAELGYPSSTSRPEANTSQRTRRALLRRRS